MSYGWLTTKELAARWNVKTTTLANWRCLGTGPRWEKMGWAVIYRMREVERFERQRPQLLQHSRT